MSAIEDAKEALLASFVRRKKAAAISNSELARRAGRSLNTVKSYLRGTKVRDTTVQKIHEALNSYIAEQTQLLEPDQTITQLHRGARNSATMARDAAQHCERFVESLKEAIEKASDETVQPDTKAIGKIEIAMAQAQGLLNLVNNRRKKT
ncbi:MAG: hypothetical protein GY717_17245 [Rhodobacteraceae bacterium]|nr:hypothetical protein [Paracoccaceae bacterium]